MLNKFRPRRSVLLAMGALALSAALPLQAQDVGDWPNKPIHLIVPYAPGGATDVTARIVSHRLGERLGQSVVVENRGGANGTIGTSAVARAKPDGYTLLLNTAGAQTLSPLLYDTADYDGLDSFEPVSLIARLSFVLVTHPSVPANTVQELVSLIKKNPNDFSLSSGSAIIGLMNEHFKSIIGAPEVVNAQYRGTGPQLTAVVSGEVQMTFDPFHGMAMIEAGRVKPLAVLSDKRSSVLPDVPTMKEAGIEGMEFSSWAALLAPKGTPQPIVDKLYTELKAVLEMPEVREQLENIDYEVVGSTPQELAETIKNDTARWAEIIKISSYKPS